jgi:phosphoglycerol geranylgeranyltransferase
MKFKKFIKKLSSRKRALLAVLVDPDKYNPELIHLADKQKVDCILVGGSVIEKGNISKTIQSIKTITKIPLLLFPGDETQLDDQADGMLLPSLLSGRNPEYLIGKQVKMAPVIHKMKLKVIPTAYLLIKGGKTSTTQKVTATSPLNPAKKSDILNTCLAAGQLGFKAIYLEAGSGAKQSVAEGLIKAVKRITELPVIVGGGMDGKDKVVKAINAGADMVVIGNALEKNVNLLTELSACFR